MTNPPPSPDEIFLHLIITFLTPMFLAAAGGDTTHARAAATQTVTAYAARNPTDLLPIAQVIAFGLAVLDSLNRSMDETLPAQLVLRFRASATSLNRAAEQCRRALRAPPPADTTQHYDPQQEEALIAGLAQTEQRLAQASSVAPKPPAPQPQSKPPAPQPQPTPEAHRAAWATAMTKVAREFTADLAHLPPAQRQEATLRATVLNSVARELLTNHPPNRQA